MTDGKCVHDCCYGPWCCVGCEVDLPKGALVSGPAGVSMAIHAYVPGALLRCAYVEAGAECELPKVHIVHMVAGANVKPPRTNGKEEPVQVKQVPPERLTETPKAVAPRVCGEGFGPGLRATCVLPDGHGGQHRKELAPAATAPKRPEGQPSETWTPERRERQSQVVRERLTERYGALDRRQQRAFLQLLVQAALKVDAEEATGTIEHLLETAAEVGLRIEVTFEDATA